MATVKPTRRAAVRSTFVGWSVWASSINRMRHYGYLSAAAVKAYRRLRFLLGGTRFAVELPETELMRCPCCDGFMERLRKIQPARRPPLSSALLRP